MERAQRETDLRENSDDEKSQCSDTSCKSSRSSFGLGGDDSPKPQKGRKAAPKRAPLIVNDLCLPIKVLLGSRIVLVCLQDYGF